MRKLLELARCKADDLRRRIAALKGKPEAGSPTAESSEIQVADVPKPPPDLPLFFMLSHLEDDGPVRMDGVKLGVCEVTGLEIDEPKLGAFAGALNACEFPSSCSSGSTRRAWAACGRTSKRPSRGTYPRRRGPPPSRFSVY